MGDDDAPSCRCYRNPCGRSKKRTSSQEAAEEHGRLRNFDGGARHEIQMLCRNVSHFPARPSVCITVIHWTVLIAKCQKLRRSGESSGSRKCIDGLLVGTFWGRLFPHHASHCFLFLSYSFCFFLSNNIHLARNQRLGRKVDVICYAYGNVLNRSRTVRKLRRKRQEAFKSNS